MELILLENISNLGKIGEKVIVKNGFGRNFLLKKGKALRYNKQNQEIVNALPGFDYDAWNAYSGENRYWIIEYVDFYFQNVDGITKSEYFDLTASLASTDKAFREAAEIREKSERLKYLKEN